MQLCGLSKARPISCSHSPAFLRLQTLRFSIAESPNLIPRLMPTPPLQNRFTLDGVASTYRMHRPYRTSGFARFAQRIPGFRFLLALVCVKREIFTWRAAFVQSFDGSPGGGPDRGCHILNMYRSSRVRNRSAIRTANEDTTNAMIVARPTPAVPPSTRNP